MYRATAFISQLGRILPLQVNLKVPTKPPRVEYRTVEEIKAALRARGIDPDVIERSMMPKFLQEQRKEEEVRAALRERGIDPDILEAPPDVLAAIGLKFLQYKKPDPVQ
jgi:SOS response regulatory protein OraA/RecX